MMNTTDAFSISCQNDEFISPGFVQTCAARFLGLFLDFCDPFSRTFSRLYSRHRICKPTTQLLMSFPKFDIELHVQQQCIGFSGNKRRRSINFLLYQKPLCALQYSFGDIQHFKILILICYKKLHYFRISQVLINLPCRRYLYIYNTCIFNDSITPHWAVFFAKV